MTGYQSHPEYRAFLASIRANPEDDLRRLVLCDWLEERQQPAAAIRARFIRRQVAGNPAANVPLTVLVELEPALGGRQPHQYATNVSNKGGAEVTFGDTTFVYTRGFVSTVRGPLVALVGGECNRCGGRRHRHDQPGVNYWGSDPCPDCQGTGTTTGVLSSIVENNPVATVTVTDREPAHLLDNHSGETSWWWLHPERYSSHMVRNFYWADGSEGVDVSRHALPEPVLSLIRNPAFPTRAAALDSLSAALIQWAESQSPSEVPA